MRYIDEMDISGKKVFIRVDFNVPLDENQNITDDNRIQAALPTIEYALKKGASLILASHLGRPKGQRNPKFSMEPVAKRLGELLNKEVKLAPDCIGPEVANMVAAMQPGEVIMLENLRFHKEETEDDPEFARKLAALADVFINDAFAVCHRRNASVHAITEFVKECGAGLLIKNELHYYEKALESPKHPLGVIVGGVKISSKLGALQNLMQKVDKLFVGGAMANTFLVSQGYKVGKSLIEKDMVDTAARLIETGKEKGISLFLPVDVVIAKKLEKNAPFKEVDIANVPDDWQILDVGTKTVQKYADELKECATVIWNGPLGAFETSPFDRGTIGIAKCVAELDALTVVGGGDTAAALKHAGVENKVSYISTGGGAFLKLLEGKKLPAIEALENCGK